jgi:hypothetical protein
MVHIPVTPALVCGILDSGTIVTNIPNPVLVSTAMYRTTRTATTPMGPFTNAIPPEANDCDGSVDKAVTSTFYQESDGDGYGNPDAPIEVCSAPVLLIADLRGTRVDRVVVTVCHFHWIQLTL